MVMGGDQSQLHLVEHDGCLHFSWPFVIQNMELGEDANGVELVNQDLVGPYHFIGSPVLHGFNKNCIAVNFSENHDVLVAAAGFLGESPRLVGVNFLGCFVLHVPYTIEDSAFFLGRACAVFYAKSVGAVI